MVPVLEETIQIAQTLCDAASDRATNRDLQIHQEDTAFNTNLAVYTENLRSTQERYAADLIRRSNIMDIIASSQADLNHLNTLLTAHPEIITRIQEEQDTATASYQERINFIWQDFHTRTDYITQHLAAAQQALTNHCGYDPDAYNTLHAEYLNQPPLTQPTLPHPTHVMPGRDEWNQAQHFPYQICALHGNRYDATSPSSWLSSSPSSTSYQ
jgi:hypothetical protein